MCAGINLLLLQGHGDTGTQGLGINSEQSNHEQYAHAKLLTADIGHPFFTTWTTNVFVIIKT